MGFLIENNYLPSAGLKAANRSNLIGTIWIFGIPSWRNSCHCQDNTIVPIFKTSETKSTGVYVKKVKPQFRHTSKQWRNQSNRATWATDKQHQCHIECFINLRAGQPGQSKGQPGHCPQLPRCSYATASKYIASKTGSISKNIDKLLIIFIFIYIYIHIYNIYKSVLVAQFVERPPG